MVVAGEFRAHVSEGKITQTQRGHLAVKIVYQGHHIDRAREVAEFAPADAFAEPDEAVGVFFHPLAVYIAGRVAVQAESSKELDVPHIHEVHVGKNLISVFLRGQQNIFKIFFTAKPAYQFYFIRHRMVNAAVKPAGEFYPHVFPAPLGKVLYHARGLFIGSKF